MIAAENQYNRQPNLRVYLANFSNVQTLSPSLVIDGGQRTAERVRCSMLPERARERQLEIQGFYKQCRRVKKGGINPINDP